MDDKLIRQHVIEELDFERRIDEVKKKILAALHRNAQVEGKSVTVSAQAGTVTLIGHLRTWQERSVVERAACSAPGVVAVVN